MQWILQDFEDTQKLGDALARLGLPHTFHKVVPFVGELRPEPVIADPGRVVLFGSYALRHYAERQGLRPGVFTVRPFVHEAAWAHHLLNGPDATFLTLDELPDRLGGSERDWFVRPVDDSKAHPGTVMASAELIAMAQKVLALDEADVPVGSLRHDTALMLTEPVRILREWRVWIVSDQIVTYSLYREGYRVVYRPEIDEDALRFVRTVIAANPRYAPAFVMDVCRTERGLHILETNCINAAGFYAADLVRLAAAIEALG